MYIYMCKRSAIRVRVIHINIFSPSFVNRVQPFAYVGLTIVPVNKAIGEQIALHIRNAGVL